MTYQHALRYLAAHDPSDVPPLPLDELYHSLSKGMATPFVVCLSHDVQGSATARLLRSVLLQAGIHTLHLIDAPEYELRNRYLLDGAPLSPTRICPHAQEVRSAEIKLCRYLTSQGKATAGSVFPSAHRALAVLMRCLDDAPTRAVLIEGNSHTPYFRALCDMMPHLRAITLLSATDQGGEGALSCIHTATREVISHPCGPALFRACSDACVRTGSRLSIIAKKNHRCRSLTLGGQILDHADIRDCRIGSGSTLAADAAVLAAEGAFALRRAGLVISNEHIKVGLSQAALPMCLTPISIDPLTVSACADNDFELSLVMRDLAALSDLFPRPRQIVLDPTLEQAFEKHASFADALFYGKAPVDSEPSGCSIIIGSPSFIKQTANF